MLYLNNCDGWNHPELYGKDAFFDLYVEDGQPKKLVPDQKCLVATRSKEDGKVTFSWFSFSRTSKSECVGRDGKVHKCKVFHGNKIKEQGPYSQADAASPIRAFFTKNGEFKQWKFHEG